MATPKRGTSIEKENPFRPGSEIRKEVDDLLDPMEILLLQN